MQSNLIRIRKYGHKHDKWKWNVSVDINIETEPESEAEEKKRGNDGQIIKRRNRNDITANKTV